MILKRLAPGLAYLGTAALVLAAATAVQGMELPQFGFIGAFLSAWLLTVLLFGVSMRNSLLFSTLFFIKPLPTAFVCVLFILLFTLLLEFQRGKLKQLIIPYPVILAVLMGTAIYGIARARSDWYAYLYFLSTAVLPAIAMLIAANSSARKTDYMLWLKAIALIGTFLAVIGVPMAILNPGERCGSLWITAMTINGFYLLAFFFSIALGVKAGKTSERYLWYVCALLVLLGMLYTYTRVTLVAVFAGFFLLMLKMKRMRLFGMGLVLLVPLIIPSSMVSRIELGLTFDYSIFIRFLAWYYSLQQIASHPWFGIGIDVWKDWYAGAVPMDMLYAEHSHNLPLKIWLELGVFGFISYFYVIVAVLRKYYLRVVKPDAGNFHRIVLIGVIALLIACLTDIFIQQYSVALAFWITLSLMYMLSRARGINEEQ
ncbi:MAG: O-antigen ligase family protein [Candidatus Cloacimonadota bacterium]|nr:O-antigen ligase family protein [Candidatus Cloacimonadota bacterium]